jgi:hypothetical protein
MQQSIRCWLQTSAFEHPIKSQKINTFTKKEK